MKTRESSDIDLIVDFFKTPTYFGIIKLEKYPSNTFNIRVDSHTEEEMGSHILLYINEIKGL